MTKTEKELARLKQKGRRERLDDELYEDDEFEEEVDKLETTL